MRRPSHLTGLAVTGFLLAGSAWGQSNPSSDDIIRSLQPGRGGLLGTGRGIRPSAPAEPAAPAVATPAPASASPVSRPARPRPATTITTTTTTTTTSATTTTTAPSVNLTVQFATNSADLTPAAAATLNQLGRALSSPALAGFHFRIEGHTDTVGSPEANKLLSERRAAKVVEYLADKFGVDRGRLESAGMGQDGLLVQTPPNTPEPRNRRVQVINLGA